VKMGVGESQEQKKVELATCQNRVEFVDIWLMLNLECPRHAPS
jgi:hypothetical protein